MKGSGKFLAAALVLVAGAAQIGCRACCTPYDYSSPVAGCQCNSCGRSGTASPMYMGSSYAGPDTAPESISSIAAKPGKTKTR